MLFGMSSTAEEGVGRPWRSGERRVNRLVFIGRNLDRTALNDGVKKCLAD